MNGMLTLLINVVLENCRHETPLLTVIDVQKESRESRLLALYAVKPNVIPSISYGPFISTRSDS